MEQVSEHRDGVKQGRVGRGLNGEGESRDKVWEGGRICGSGVCRNLSPFLGLIVQ